MPVTLIEPEPCAAQRQVMTSLGFTPVQTESSVSTTWGRYFRDDACGLHGCQIRLSNDAAPTPGEAITLILQAAFEAGQHHKVTAIRKALDIKQP